MLFLYLIEILTVCRYQTIAKKGLVLNQLFPLALYYSNGHSISASDCTLSQSNDRMKFPLFFFYWTYKIDCKSLKIT